MGTPTLTVILTLNTSPNHNPNPANPNHNPETTETYIYLMKNDILTVQPVVNPSASSPSQTYNLHCCSVHVHHSAALQYGAVGYTLSTYFSAMLLSVYVYNYYLYTSNCLILIALLYDVVRVLSQARP